jgi:hypothetical protein
LNWPFGCSPLVVVLHWFSPKRVLNASWESKPMCDFG